MRMDSTNADTSIHLYYRSRRAGARRSLDVQFMNDASHTQSLLKSYGPEMLSFLQGTSRKWDPQDIFLRLDNGGFLLSN
jgi:hypothetical protein